MSMLDIAVTPLETELSEFGAGVTYERFRTIEVDLDGRFMRSTKQEFPARLKAASVAQLAFTTSEQLSVGERIIAHVEHLGGFDGKVSGNIEGGFELCLNITTRKREKLSAQLTWLLNRPLLSGLDGRKHERFAVENKSVLLRYGNDQSVECTLLDISLSGASLETSVRPEVGSKVFVGKQHAIVRRHHDHGVGVQFLQVQEATNLQGYLS